MQRITTISKLEVEGKKLEIGKRKDHASNLQLPTSKLEVGGKKLEIGKRKDHASNL